MIASAIVIIAIIGGLGLWVRSQQEPVFADPFPEGMESAFEASGLPILSAYTTLSAEERWMIVEIRPLVCDERDSKCVLRLLEAQPWAVDVGAREASNGVVDFQIDPKSGRKCLADIRPALDRLDFPPVKALLSEASVEKNSLWVVSLVCV